MGYGFDIGLEKERLRCGGLDLGRERGVEVGGDLDLGLKREGLRLAVNLTLSLFPVMSSNLVVAVAIQTLWWKINHGEQPLVHLGCAFCSIVAGFVVKFWEYFVKVLGLIFWVI